jgi:hypothetical protein
MRNKVIVLVIKGKEVELSLSDFPIPISVKDKKSGKVEIDSKRTLDARLKDGEIKIRVN